MNEVNRFSPRIEEGLSTTQINERIKNKQVNYDTDVPTKSIKQIVLLNIFTLFNILNFFLAFLICLAQSYKNLLFMGGIICNTCISIFQEIRTKKTIDKLSFMNTTKAKVIRNGQTTEIPLDHIVLDDIILYKVGEQVAVDTIIQKGTCEVNESFITGEDIPILKKEGDMILSGSFIVTGHIIGKVEHVGLDNYTAKISKEARYMKKVNSILMNSLNSVIKVVSIVVIPLGILMFIKQYQLSHSFDISIVNTVASMIGMIPEGLVLLTSTVLAVAVIKLSKYNVLVQQLYCIEMLARVDTLCLDKTGTITEGKMEVSDLIVRNGTLQEMEQILQSFATYSEDENATMVAIKKRFYHENSIKPEKIIPFKSENKYSGIVLQKKTYLLGAPEILLKKDYPLLKEMEDKFKNYRVMVLIKDEDIVLGFLLIQDVIRKEASETLQYFKDQGVSIKVISGDHPLTVSNIAKRVGIEHYEKAIDLSVVTDEELENIVSQYTVFGRVKPNQKKILIEALQKKNHTVAMIGDGVNDVLALKEADCSIAMKSGSDAAKNVSHLVLLDDNFDSMPKILLEGRQTVNNIERSASLFLTKTIYASLFAILFLFIPRPYPFVPIHLTLTSVVAIGIPSFILALEPNKKLIRGNFFSNVLVKSLPSAVVIVFNILFIMVISSIYPFTKSETSTLCVIMNAYVSFMLLYQLSKPMDLVKWILLISMILIFIVEILGFRQFFSISQINIPMIVVILALIIISTFLLDKITGRVRKYLDKKYN